jgi:hypothetical protein
MEPKPNNGTLRLPLKPIGTHKPEDTPEVPEDPVQERPTISGVTEVARPTTPGEVSPSTEPSSEKGDDGEGDQKESKGGANEDNKDGDTNNDDDKDKGGDEEGKDGIKGLWHWFTGKVNEVWDSITGS